MYLIKGTTNKKPRNPTAAKMKRINNNVRKVELKFDISSRNE